MCAVRRPAAVLALLLSALAAGAADWPQFRGPAREGVAAADEKGLLRAWPKDGPARVAAVADAGAGYSSVAVVGGRLFTLGLRGENEMVLAYGLADGKQAWATRLGGAYRNGFGDGPRSTPTIDGDRLYALGANGDLACLAVADGKEIWRRNILADFQGDNIGWGISESPLVEGKLVVVTPGGDGGTVVALDKLTGKTVWASKDPNAGGREAAGYASPIAFEADGVRQAATFTSKGGYGVRLADGKFLWRYDKAANGTANIATPVYHDGRILFTSDYGTGAGLAKLAGGKAEEVYFHRNLKNHHGGVVRLGGHVYGFDSDILVCMEFATGKVVWKDRSVGKGSLCAADGCLYLLSEDGTVGLAEATPRGYVELARFRLPDRSDRASWAYPAVANGRLVVRDQERIHVFDIKAK